MRNLTNNCEEQRITEQIRESGGKRQKEERVECVLPGFERPREPVFCRVVQGQWQDPEGEFLSSPPKIQIEEFSRPLEFDTAFAILLLSVNKRTHNSQTTHSDNEYDIATKAYC